MSTSLIEKGYTEIGHRLRMSFKAKPLSFMQSITYFSACTAVASISMAFIAMSDW
jgi:hypothetical protein